MFILSTKWQCEPRLELAIRSLLKRKSFQAYTVSYGHHASQRIRDYARKDYRWRSDVALVRATLSPKRPAEAISGHLLRADRSLPAEQNKSP